MKRGFDIIEMSMFCTHSKYQLYSIDVQVGSNTPRASASTLRVRLWSCKGAILADRHA